MAKATTKGKTATNTAVRKKRARKNVVKGIAHIHSTVNNTIVSITDENGSVLTWSSAGALDSRVLKNLLLMQHKWQLKQQLQVQKIME